MSDELTSLSSEQEKKFEEMFQRGQSRRHAILEAAGGEGIFEVSPEEDIAVEFVPFPPVDLVLEYMEGQVFPGKSQALAELPKILSEAQRAKTVEDLASIIGGKLIPAAIWIGYKAYEVEPSAYQAVLAELMDIEATLHPNVDSVYALIERLSEQLAKISRMPSGREAFSNRDPAYIDQLSKVVITVGGDVVGNRASSLVDHLPADKDIIKELRELPLKDRQGYVDMLM
uniref:Uncharacterized protein n=1 Tax=Trichuris muris TaxID=70415 RepID=A0A5S6QT03_TRIMR